MNTFSKKNISEQIFKMFWKPFLSVHELETMNNFDLSDNCVQNEHHLNDIVFFSIFPEIAPILF